MNYLGIDFGLKKVGLALAASSLAEPYRVLHYDSELSLISQIKEICQKEAIEKIIVGLSEGEIANKTKSFADNLKLKINLPLEFFDETLTTLDAQRLSQESGIKRSKRKSLEDAYAATIMLQNYLDTNL